ncbi:unnamed protein product [Hymenolepis diminuta]|uniref:Pyrin domain-containing protein n=1 Tax=Hymenolepis diminuta TaxID=6216 RepID=A0A0R3SRE0_HYMDI|nr:unnamed protein product [Hymenolepis diminuta]
MDHTDVHKDKSRHTISLKEFVKCVIKKTSSKPDISEKIVTLVEGKSNSFSVQEDDDEEECPIVDTTANLTGRRRERDHIVIGMSPAKVTVPPIPTTFAHAMLTGDVDATEVAGWKNHQRVKTALAIQKIMIIPR